MSSKSKRKNRVLVTRFLTMHSYLKKSTISKLKRILSDLNKEGILIKRKTKQDFKGIKEIGYDYIDKS